MEAEELMSEALALMDQALRAVPSAHYKCYVRDQLQEVVAKSNRYNRDVSDWIRSLEFGDEDDGHEDDNDC